MHPLPTRRTSVLLLACTCASAWAQDTPPIEVTAVYTFESEDTRYPNGSTDEQIGKAELGLQFHTIQGMQKIHVDARLVNYQYQNNTAQSHTETNYLAGWQWAVTPELHGNLIVSQQEAPRPDIIDGESNVPNRQTRKHYRADAEYGRDGPWHVLAGVSRNQNTSQFLTDRNTDSRSDTREVGVRYDTAKGSWVKFSLKSTDGRYLTGTSARDDDYQQTEQDLRAHWSVSAATSLDLYLTQLEREHQRNTQLDFSGLNYGASASWAVTGRSTLVLGYAHALAAVVLPLPFLTEQDSLSLGWNWQTSSRTQVRVRQAWQRLDYRSPANEPYAGYQNNSRDTSVTLVWTPGTNWELSAALQRQAHESSRPGNDYSSKHISVSAKFSF
jgi:hypothetical protein